MRTVVHAGVSFGNVAGWKHHHGKPGRSALNAVGAEQDGSIRHRRDGAANVEVQDDRERGDETRRRGRIYRPQIHGIKARTRHDVGDGAHGGGVGKRGAREKAGFVGSCARAQASPHGDRYADSYERKPDWLERVGQVEALLSPGSVHAATSRLRRVAEQIRRLRNTPDREPLDMETGQAASIRRRHPRVPLLWSSPPQR